MYTPVEFFNLPDYLQRKILLEDLDYESIRNLCIAVKQEEKRSANAAKFSRDFCTNFRFWRDKFQYDFPGSFDYIMGIAIRDGKTDSNSYWWSIYIKYSRDMPLARRRLVEIARTGEWRGDEFAKYLVHGVDFNIQDENGRTPLMVAAMNGNLGAVLGFLAGTDLNIRDNDGNTALSLALMYGYPHIATLLLSRGIDLDVDSQDLFLASAQGYAGSVKRLLAAGVDVNAVAERGGTALTMAAHEGYHDVVDALLAAGADANAQRNDGVTALMWASYEGYPRLVERLRVSGADVDLQDIGGETALILALKGFEEASSGAWREVVIEDIRDSYTTTIFELIRYKPDPTLQNNEGVTAIDLAEKMGLDNTVISALEYLKRGKEESKRKRSRGNGGRTKKRRRQTKKKSK